MRPDGQSAEPGAPALERPESAEVLRRLEAVMDTALAELSLDALLDELLERVRHLLATDTAVILLREGDVLAARAAKGLEEEVRLGIRVPLGKGFAGRVAAEKSPVIVDDVRQADLFNPLLRAKELRALLGVPILFEGEVIGVLHVGTLRARAFGVADAQLLQVVADRIGLGIAYSRLYEEERRARAEAEAARREIDDFFEQAAIGLHWVGPDGTILRVNQTELDLLGYTREEYVGRNIAEFHADRQVIDDMLARLARGETVIDQEARLFCKDGSIRHVLTDSNVLWEGGRFVHTRGFTRDITARRKIEHALRAAERRTRAIIDTAYEAFVAIDDAGVVLDWNRQAESLFGWSRQEAIGQVMSEMIIPERFRGEHSAGLARFLATGEGPLLDRVVRMSALHRDGSEFSAELTISPVRAETGWIFSAFIRDITKRKQAEEERERLLATTERALAEAEAANRAKDEFLAVLSHELRSPLNALRTWASLLRTGKLTPEKTARALEAIERNVLVQTRLIDDLLDVSRIGSGKLTLELAPVDLTAVLEGALEAVRAPAEDKGIRLEGTLTRDTLEVRGDAARLQQVMWNLLSNAVKFSQRGGCVRLSLAPEDADAVVTVTDEGEGIDPALLPHVFERFRQGDSSTTRSHGGLGLGLAIVQHLVQRHGGTVRAESEGKGRGACFTVRLPLAELRAATFPAVVPLRPALAPGFFEPRPVLRGIRVLLVDDEPEARESIAVALEACQASVTAVGSAEEALERLATEPADVLVADIAMPGEDGYSLIRRLRVLPPERCGRVPAVALTAFAGRDHRARALAAGFAAHLAKPVDVRDLLQVLASLVGQDDPPAAPR